MPGLAGLGLGFVVAIATGCERSSDADQFQDSPDPAPLRIRPASITLAPTNTTTVLTATGGAAPYHWFVADSALGSVADTDAATATYTRNTAQGAQTVRVEDRNRWLADCIVVQE